MKKKKNKGGRPPLEDGKSAIRLTLSMPYKDYKLFITYAEIEGMSNSEFFRRVFEFWKASEEK